MNPKARKIIKGVLNGILWGFLVLITILVVLVFIAKIENPELPSLGGKYYMTVASESMTGTFNKGDIIVVDSYEGKDKNKFEEKDVITFYCYVGEEKIINSHRIISYEDNELTGERTYHTKGDANELPDGYSVTAEEIIGKWEGGKLAGLGGFLQFLQEPLGFILVIILPMAAFLIYQLVVFIKTLLTYKNKDKIIISKDEEELIKQRAIAEYLAEQAKKQQEELDNNKKEE